MITPTAIIGIILAVALIYARRKNGRKIVVLCLTLAFIFYYAFASSPLPYLIINLLESQYPSIVIKDIPVKCKTIVVLTGYGVDTPGRFASGEINCESGFRILETQRIAEARPEMSILISGSASVADLMKENLSNSGLSMRRIKIEGDSRNTYESAVNLRRYLDRDPFILVTTARHMYRAVGAFRKLEMNAIPAPTGYQYVTRDSYGLWFPSSKALRISDKAFYEIFAIIWYKLRGRL